MESPKSAIVSGGTYGIGRAITLALARAGYDVVAFGLEARQLSSVAGDGIQELQAALAQDGLAGEVVEADVGDPADVQRVVELALDRSGRVDALVNNAALGPLGTVLETDEAVWDRVIEVNLKGAYLMSRAVLPAMIEQGGGAIVNIGSGAGHGKPNMAAYAASKGGLMALNAAMAYDHLHDRVRVNMVVPGGGGIVTGMSVGRAGGDRAAVENRVVPGSAAGRPAVPEDIAAAVLFLTSDAAAAISGTVLDVGCFAGQGGPAGLAGPAGPTGLPPANGKTKS